MRQLFFLGVIVFAVVAGILYFGWSVIKALYDDWSLTRGVNGLRKESEKRREDMERINRERLDNGCSHVFGETLGGFPPKACRKCGLEQDKPAGECDHVWRVGTDPLPGSKCEKCGKTYKPRKATF